MFFSASKESDILRKKQAQLNNYTAQFDAAVSMVTMTIDSLSDLNRSIEAAMTEIEDYQRELSVTKSGLDIARSKNNKVIENFKALLCVD